MLTGLASGPVAPIAPPPSPVQSKAADPASDTGDFKTVLRDVPKDEGAASDQKTNGTSQDNPSGQAAAASSAASQSAGSQVDPARSGKDKNDDSKDGKIRKGSSPNENEKVAVATTLPSHGLVLAKAPLALVLPSFGIATPAEANQATETALLATLGDTGEQQTTGSATGRLVPQAQVDVLPLNPGLPVPAVSVPTNGKLAFSVLVKLNDASAQAGGQQDSKTSLARLQNIRETTQQLVDAISSPQAGVAKDAIQTELARRNGNGETIPSPREISAAAALDLPAMATPPDTSEPVRSTASRSFAIQDIQPVLPEIPKPPTSTEILLHLGVKDQSTASVRMVDRAGTVNVSVHASDPDLRSSLRSNLSDLASQLTGQGFKTEVVRPTVVAANADNQPDSRNGGQGSSGPQHHSTPDGRQSHRSRRNGSELWLDELEQETAGNTGVTGGNS